MGQVTANIPSPINLCDDNNPGDQIEVFDLTSREDEILNGQTNVVISYHLTSGDALGNGGFIANPQNYTNLSNPQQIFIRAQGSGDFDITTMDIEVVQYAMAEAEPENLFIDEGDANGQAFFDLTENENAMLGGQFAIDFVFSYYLTEADCDGKINPLATPTMFENTENPQSVFVRMEPFNAPCGTCYSFVISSDGILGTETNALENLTIFPNPATNFITVTGKDLAFAKILIRDIQGREIINMKDKSDVQTISISALNKGVYFITITVDENQITQRFIKQ